MSEDSGRFLVRLPPKLHTRLKREAQAAHLSLNQYVVQRLETRAERRAVESLCQKNFGKDCLGVIIFGSTVRGEAKANSDIDLLIVLSSDRAIDRSLYTLWDETIAPDLEGPYSPQFSHLPTDIQRPSSLWLEVALEGEVLSTSAESLRRSLTLIRDLVARGIYVRKISYGHPYWVRLEEREYANKSLAADYFEWPRKRLSALDALYKEEAWADVVRESQEAVELALKSLLRTFHIEVPRIHDVSGILEQESERFPPAIQKNLVRYMEISRNLRRDRELAFYGSEDLTPNEFYKKADAQTARDAARWVVETLIKVLNPT